MIINNSKYNKGFVLIEVILYISLLSLLITGVFSSILGIIFMENKTGDFTRDEYDLLIENYHEN